MSTAQTILVFNSTGQQGHATVQALSDLGKFKILAVTRDPSSESAKNLVNIPHVHVVKGEVGVHEHFFDQPIHGVFFVQMGFDIEAALKDIKSLLDISEKKGVRHVVFSGTDQCGHRDIGIGHPFLDAKKDVEDLLQGRKFDWTVLRPVGFMENFYKAPYKAQVTTTWLQSNHYKMISVVDIGRIAARVFAQPTEWTGKALNVAGDSLTPGEIVEVWKEVTGELLDDKEPPQFPPGFDSAMAFFTKNEFEASVEWTEQNFPGVMDLKTWLKSSNFAKA
ncbi:hypothetical protein IAR55_006730 [Kwoniella newhampshirensis]|uniref:NmrA-like domain-containing protein n=1 Tax=Kwoniella newhampshirensis TaxID=1651941 RepID=A0AAW0YTJ5_9TREE